MYFFMGQFLTQVKIQLGKTEIFTMLEGMRYLFLLLILASCASPKEVVQGYDGKELEQMMAKIQGRTPQETIKIMGTPAAYGLCKSCEKGLYRMIYPVRDMTKFYLGVQMNTDAEIDCIVLEFRPNFKMRKYYFDRKSGLSKQKNCNQKGGAIMELNRILDEQDAAEIAAQEAALEEAKKKKSK